MMVLSSIRAGLRQVWAQRQLVVPFYLANLCCGILAILPFALILDDYVGHSFMRERLGAAMDYDFFFEFIAHNETGLSAAQTMVLIVPFIYWLVLLFFSGGALAALARGGYSTHVFWSDAAKYFGRFVHLALWSLPLLPIFFSVRYLETLLQRLIWGPDPYEYVIYWGAWVKTAFGFLGLILYGIVFDYARISVVILGEHHARRALWHALKFAARHWLPTLALAGLLFCVGWSAIWVYNLFSGWMTAPVWLVVLLLLLGQQFFMAFRLALRLTGYSSQLHLYRHLTAN